MLTYKMDNEKDIMGEPLALHVPAYYGSGTELDIVVAKGSLKKKKPFFLCQMAQKKKHFLKSKRLV